MPYKSEKQRKYMEMLRANPSMQPRKGERPPMTILDRFHREEKKGKRKEK